MRILTDLVSTKFPEFSAHPGRWSGVLGQRRHGRYNGWCLGKLVGFL